MNSASGVGLPVVSASKATSRSKPSRKFGEYIAALRSSAQLVCVSVVGDHGVRPGSTSQVSKTGLKGRPREAAVSSQPGPVSAFVPIYTIAFAPGKAGVIGFTKALLGRGRLRRQSAASKWSQGGLWPRPL